MLSWNRFSRIISLINREIATLWNMFALVLWQSFLVVVQGLQCIGHRTMRTVSRHAKELREGARKDRSIMETTEDHAPPIRLPRVVPTLFIIVASYLINLQNLTSIKTKVNNWLTFDFFGYHYGKIEPITIFFVKNACRLLWTVWSMTYFTA